MNSKGYQDDIKFCHPDNLFNLLNKVPDSLITIIAPWNLLTVAVSRTVANWALENENRGFSLFPVEADFISPKSKKGLDVLLKNKISGKFENQVDLISKGKVSTVSDFSKSPMDLEALMQRQTKKILPLGLSITDHGGEPCIKFAGGWLSTHQNFAPSENYINPDLIASPVIFLNSCGLMRLGDSNVPQEYSLAFRLYSNFSQVLGAFRTITTLPDSQEIFVSGLLNGEPLGRIVNHLNREHAKIEGGGPAYTMLGNAALVAVKQVGKAEATRVLPKKYVAERFEPPQFFDLQKFNWWDNLSSVFEKCNALSNDSLEARREFRKMFQVVVKAKNVQSVLRLSSRQISVLQDEITPIYNRLRESTLNDITTLISTGAWINTIYAQFSAPPSIILYRCPRCKNTGLRKKYDIWGENNLFAVRDECDCCGTQQDSIGQRSGRRSIDVNNVDGSILITVPPLKKGEIGKVLIHRLPKSNHLDWNPTGGTYLFSKDILAMGGRRIAVAISAGDFGLQARYSSFFLPPK